MRSFTSCRVSARFVLLLKFFKHEATSTPFAKLSWNRSTPTPGVKKMVFRLSEVSSAWNESLKAFFSLGIVCFSSGVPDGSRFGHWFIDNLAIQPKGLL